MLDKIDTITTLLDKLAAGKDSEHLHVALRQPAEQIVHRDENGDPTGQTFVPLETELSYNWLEWESEVYPKPTRDEFDVLLAECSKFEYRQQRREAYPSITDQLDTLYHEGIDGWRASVDAVKQQFPKPEA